jgi:uncharacterized delta-60 repeat protein
MKNKFLLTVTFLVSSFSFSQNWGLDQDFNSVGFNTANMIVNGDDYAECSTIQSDGKILIAGYGLRIARFNTNGTLDTSFANSGYTLSYGNNVSLNYIKQIIITPTNKILVVGAIYTNKWYLYLAQYNENGTLDTTFGVGGRKNIDVGPSITMTVGNAIYTSDNKIFIATTSYFSDGDFNITKCNKFGELETAFGGTGIITYDGMGYDQGGKITLRSDGKLLLSGNSNVNPANGTYKQYVQMLINSDGTLDTTFGTSGKVLTNLATNNTQVINDMYLLTDNSILVTGSIVITNSTIYDGFVAKFNANGTLDTSFGTNGISQVFFTDTDGSQAITDMVNKITVQNDGKIIIAGFSNGAGNISKFSVALLNSTGTFDETFGNNGTMTFPINGFNDVITDVKSQSDGKIVVSGQTKINNLDRSYVVARLTPNSTLTTLETTSTIPSIQLYPNPAKETITINGLNSYFSTSKINLTLWSIEGKALKSLNLTNGNDSYELLLSTLSSGIYMLKISDGSKVITQKFVKE